jgi:RHS repeat-associated protein
VTVTLPTVTTGENGSGVAATTTEVFDQYGRVIWSKDADGYLTYTQYDQATGAVVKQIVDVDTTQTSTFSNLPSGWSTPTGGGLQLTTTMTVDDLGRDTSVTDPNGNEAYTVYDDANHSYRVYTGWNASTGTTTGPTEVVTDNWAAGYTEVLTMSATPHVTGGVPDGTEAISNLQSLSRVYYNDANQAIAEDDYFDLSGLTYSTAVGLGTLGVNYYETTQGYNNQGLPDRTVSANGTITRTVYDGEGRVVSVWVGTNDTPTSGYWSPSNPAGMTEVASFVYDNGGVGDGNLTQETLIPGGGQPNQVTDYYYDWRDRLVATQTGVGASSGTHAPIIYDTYDNLGEVTEEQTYDGDGVSSISTVAGVPQAPSASLLRSQTVYSYDEVGQVYRTQVYAVDPSTGSVSTNALTTNYYYDLRGDLVAESDPGGLWTKSVYDGAGRDVTDYTTDGAGGTTWADATSVANDHVLEQVETVYDGDSNVIETIDRQRFDNATGTGPLGNPTSGVGARVYYTADYYDAANRLIADVNVGTNGGVAWTRPSTIPTASDTVLVTSYGYNAAGEVQNTIDPNGIDTRDYYDALGRVTETIQNYTGNPETNNSDVATQYAYDGDNHVVLVQADQPGGAVEQTRYVYGVTIASGSAVNSNDLLAATEYADPSTGLASSSQEDTQTVDAFGDVLTATDRNGNVHQYNYDALGRLTADAVQTLGANVDGSVRRIEYGYDALGNVSLITSYDSYSGGIIVNQVLRQYNGLGQLTAEYQQQGGAVNTATSPVVQYAYTEMAGGANNSRLTSITYADGYQVNYNYGASGSLSDTISRLDSISDSTGILEGYKYLGLGTVVERDHPQVGVNLTYISPTGSTGDAGDQYTGLDRFGRVVEQLWQNTNTNTATDDTQYGFDADSNVLYQENKLNETLSQLFSYDGLNQLTGYQVGTLNSTKTGLTGSASASQSWGLDALGNWTSVTTDGTAQTNTANAQNEYTAVGSATPGYDADGNMTTDQNGNTLVYDAWNRLVAVKNSTGTTIATYSYDGLNRQVSVTENGTTTQLIYSADWQVLEERVDGATTAQYVWSPVYVNALVLRDAATTTPGTLDQRLWVQQDANWNVTALVDNSGNVVERFTYTPYGVVTVLAPDWSARGTSSYNWVYLFQGGRYDSASGLYTFQERQYSPTLGRWMTMDPLGLEGGDYNTYRFIGNGPTNATDPSGLEVRLYAKPIAGGSYHIRVVLWIQTRMLVFTMTAKVQALLGLRVPEIMRQYQNEIPLNSARSIRAVKAIGALQSFTTTLGSSYQLT